MIKLILCILILFSSAVIGIYLSQRLVRRKDILMCFDMLFHRAQIQIEYNAGDLCEVFSDNFADYAFTHSAPFDMQWTRFVDGFSHLLLKDDIRMLHDFSNGLGTADCESQKKHLSLYSELLREHIESAQEDIRTKSKMLRVTPISVGIAVTLLLI